MVRVKGGGTKMCRRTHGCGLWRSIHEGWESFSKHLSFVAGEGTCIRFWHDRWIGDNTLKDLYPELYVCSAAKETCISEVLWILEGGTSRVWDFRFYRAFEDWKLVASYSLLQCIQPHIPWGDSLIGGIPFVGGSKVMLLMIRFFRCIISCFGIALW